MHGGTRGGAQRGTGTRAASSSCGCRCAGTPSGEGRRVAEVEPASAPPTLRLLVVDDNLDAADSLAMVLRMMGHDVQTAHDGLEAVGAATTFHPDVVLLDIGLPKMSGYEVARRIRDQGRGSETILVALTGWGQEEDRNRSREAGFHHHMTKPVDFKALQKLLLGMKPSGRRRRIEPT